MKRYIYFIVLIIFFSLFDNVSAKSERLIIFEEGVIEKLSSPSLYHEKIQLQPLNEKVAIAELNKLPEHTLNTCEKILHQSPFVKTVELNFERSIDNSEFIQMNDPLSSQQWWISNLNMSKVWAIGQKYGRYETTIAVIDSGVNRNHPDLQNKRILPGYDFVTNTAVKTDLNGHGTSIIGLLHATTNNNEGISGLLHKYPVNILPLRVMDQKGTTKVSSIVQAIDFAIQKKVDVINLSLGGAFPSVAEQNAIEKAIEKGILVVASAGNDALKGNPINYPAAYPGVIGVGSITPENKRAPFSNYHHYVDFVAPGTNLLSTNIYNDYSTVQGTSFSTPFVSALASMIYTIDPTVTKDVIYHTLQQAAQPLSKQVPSNEYGYGALQFVDTLEHFIHKLPKVVWSAPEWNIPLRNKTKWLQLDENHEVVLLEVGETIHFKENTAFTTNRSPIITIHGQQIRANAVGSTRFKAHQFNGSTKTIDIKITNDRHYTLAGFTKEPATFKVTPIEKASFHPDGLIHLARTGNVKVHVTTEETEQQLEKHISGKGLSQMNKPKKILYPKHSTDNLTLLFNEPLNNDFVQKAIHLSTDERNEHPLKNIEITLQNEKVIIKPKVKWPNVPIFIHVYDTKNKHHSLKNPQTFYFLTQSGN